MILQITDATGVLSTTDVTVIGILLFVVFGLGWFIRYLLKEIKEKDNTIIDFGEKYFTMSGQMRDLLRKNENDN